MIHSFLLFEIKTSIVNSRRLVFELKKISLYMN